MRFIGAVDPDYGYDWRSSDAERAIRLSGTLLPVIAIIASVFCFFYTIERVVKEYFAFFDGLFINFADRYFIILCICPVVYFFLKACLILAGKHMSGGLSLLLLLINLSALIPLLYRMVVVNNNVDELLLRFGYKILNFGQEIISFFNSSFQDPLFVPELIAKYGDLMNAAYVLYYPLLIIAVLVLLLLVIATVITAVLLLFSLPFICAVTALEIQVYLLKHLSFAIALRHNKKELSSRREKEKNSHQEYLSYLEQKIQGKEPVQIEERPESDGPKTRLTERELILRSISEVVREIRGDARERALKYNGNRTRRIERRGQGDKTSRIL